ncbi:MAG TPA: hypothetical protein VGJ92_10620 [Methanocella sp.]|jgi:hypothetical protein
MSDSGYSTVMDAILFLALVGVCAVILGPAVSGHVTERASSDRGLRERVADALCTLETAQADHFEYRVLGDVADRLAEAGGINASGDILYKDVAKALLGRGDRHKTVMDIAAGNAASQFFIEYGDTKIRANPVTTEYDLAVSALVDGAVRSVLDSRYSYEFTLRWTPLAGVPLVGEVRAGQPCTAGAASSSMRVSMPYMTGITRPLLESINEPDLKVIDSSVDEYLADGAVTGLRQSLGSAIEKCLKNSTALALGEIWNNTLGSSATGNGSSNPLNILKRLVDGKTPDTVEMTGLNFSARDLAGSLADLYYRAAADGLAEDLTGGIADGRLDAEDAHRIVIDWLKARYDPSSAVATVSVWTGAYA